MSPTDYPHASVHSVQDVPFGHGSITHPLPAFQGREHEGDSVIRPTQVRRSYFGADSDRQYRDIVRVATGLSSLLLLAVAASACSSTPSSAPAPKSTTTTELPSTTTTELPSTTTPLYSIEQCGGITTSSDLRPNVDNRTLLLTLDDGPPGYTYGAAKMASGPTVTASVPSYSPAVYESFQVPASEGGGSGQEVIGEIDSSNAASQLAQQVEAHLVSCYGGKQVSLPTTVPGVTAETYQYGPESFRRVGTQCHRYRCQGPLHRLLAVVQQQYLHYVRRWVLPPASNDAAFDAEHLRYGRTRECCPRKDRVAPCRPGLWCGIGAGRWQLADGKRNPGDNRPEPAFRYTRGTCGCQGRGAGASGGASPILVHDVPPHRGQ